MALGRTEHDICVFDPRNLVAVLKKLRAKGNRSGLDVVKAIEVPGRVPGAGVDEPASRLKI